MATKSILKNVDITNEALAKSLVIALEKAANIKSPTVTLSRTYEEVHGEKIKLIFSQNV